MEHYRYIASCVFTREYPELSIKVQDYLRQRFGMEIIRCCVDKYKVTAFEQQMKDCVAQQWRMTPHFIPFDQGDVMVSICHNCSAIFQEQHPGTRIMSLWELILTDDSFPYPDYHGDAMTVQDCWRQYDNVAEQDAVRELMRRMNITIVELNDNRENTKFCGVSNLQPSNSRNKVLAPHRFVENAQGMFLPHSEDEQRQLMLDHCAQYTTHKVVTYCHYCAQGLDLVGQPHFHLAQLLFP